MGRELGQVSVTTKSGTNAYHGTVFEFLRDDMFDAVVRLRRNGTEKSPFKWNGADHAGGWSCNKLFFLGNYEGFRLGTSCGPLASRRLRCEAEISQISTALKDPDRRAIPGEHHPGKSHRPDCARASSITRRRISRRRALPTTTPR